MTTKHLVPLLALAACHDPAPTATAPTSPPSATAARDPRLDTIDRMRAALERKDARAVAALYADDAELATAGGKTVHGRAAIEAALRDQIAPAEVIHVATARVWLTRDVAVVEDVFRVHHGIASPLYDVGESALSIYWFDRDGKIAREHEYRDQPTLEKQAAGAEDAPELPNLPTATEVYAAPAGADDAALVAWARASEAKPDADPSFNDERLMLECIPGHVHVSSRAEYDAFLAPWRAAFPRYTNEVANVWVAGDYVIVEDVFRGTQTGALGKLPASDKPVAWHWGHVWKVESQKIVRHWQWGNFAELYQQIGAPAPSSKLGHPACSIAS